MGDYGQGDFLGIGKRLKKIAHGALGFAGHLAHAIPGYNVAHAVYGAVHGHHHAATHSSFAGAGGGSIAMLAPGTLPPTSSTSIGYGLFSHQTYAVAPPVHGSGYHVIKKGPHAGKLTKNRHMHVTNPRALRRAIRRARGFEKLARKVLGFTSPHKPKGRPYFKHARARK
jgi:hypothetical protein